MTAKVDEYWSRFFGLTVDQLLGTDIHVVPHAALGEYSGAWIFWNGHTTVISVPELWVHKIRHRIQSIGELTPSEQTARELFGSDIDRIIGPAYHGYVEAKDFRPRPSSLVRQLHDDDLQGLDELAKSGDLKGWSDGGFDGKSDGIFGCYVDRQLISVSRFLSVLSYGAHMGIYTHPDHRHKGYAALALSACMQHVLNQGLLVVCQTLLVNKAAIELSKSLGCKEYARHLAVRLKS